MRHRELMASDSAYAADWHTKSRTTTGLRTAADYDQIGKDLQAYGRQNIIQIPGLEAGGTWSGGMSAAAAKAMVDRIRAEDNDRYKHSFEARNQGYSDRTVRLEVAFGDVEAKLDGVRADQSNGLVDAFRRQARSGY